MSLDKLIVKVIGMDREQRIALGRNCSVKMHEGFNRMGYEERECSEMMTEFIKLFVSADKKCSYEEYDLINSIYKFDMTYDEFYEMTNGGAVNSFVELTDELIDSFDADLKYNICLFGLCILLSDDEMTSEEHALFKKIWQ